MKKVYFVIAMLVAMVGAAAAEDICAAHNECDDGNECTVDLCGTSITYPDSATMLIDYGTCESVPVYNGMPCHTDGKLGKCVSGVCERNTANARPNRNTAVETIQPVPVDAPDDEVPEFSAIAAGLAFAGAGAGYMLIRRMK
jgi:hypothetical protein